MKKMGCNEIRKSFTDFFESKGHYVGKSSSLIPKNDKSLLLINSGMAPLKNYFSGVEVPPRNRMSTVQKCIRTGDIENVGKTARHGTFFEMMGNFSFGDYFKEDAIKWAWEFVTKHLEIPEEKIWATVYLNDDEARDLWLKYSTIPQERIVRLGKDDNFWEIGLGPCGPCSELYYDRGEQYGCDNPDCKPGCDCDRYLEFWNLVFTQFDRQEDGSYPELAHKNIDTGMGLERIGCIMQGVDNIFEVDTIRAIIDEIERVSGVKYGVDAKSDVSIRIITDHIRAMSFMIADGILPSNEGRGYVLRRLLRRAARHGKLLGIKEDYLYNLFDVVKEVSGEAYPELIEKEGYIKKVIKIEEEKFNETIDQGSEILNGYIEELKANNESTLAGEKVFKLYDTYGFPMDLTQEILEEVGFDLDEEGFNAEMDKQRERARSARGNMEGESWKEDPLSTLDASVASTFEGYKHLSTTGVVTAIVKGDEIVDTITEGDEAVIVLDRTTFYAEGGGQVGDSGILENENALFEVITTKKGANNTIKHIGVVKKGSINTKDALKSLVNREIRMASARNHSATHLLHKALKETLGEHVNQAGSLVTPDRLRFDITHFEPISKEELDIIERKVNDVILQSLDIECEVMGINEAKEKGAMALFGEKYGNEVRVVSMGDYSIELCGGTHVSNVGEIGLFKIVSETGVAAGIRRIEALTGRAAIKYMEEKQRLLKEACAALKCTEKDVLKKISTQGAEIKEKDKEIAELKSKLTSGALDDILNSAKDINGVKTIAYGLEGVDGNALRDLADKIRSKMGSGVVVLVSNLGDKVNLITMATKDVLDKGIHCGKIIKEVATIVGGGGGGRPDMAQAGGKKPENIPQAIEAAFQTVENLVK